MINTSYTEQCQSHVPCNFAYKVVCIDDKFIKPVVLYRRENAVNKFIEAILNEMTYCRGVIKKHFDKNLLMSEEDK